MKTKTHIQRLVKQAFNPQASVQRKRYDPNGIRREGYWLRVDEDVEYIGYSKQMAIDYLQAIIEAQAMEAQSSCRC